MTETLTPDAVKAAQDVADLLDAWGEVNLAQGRDEQSKDMAKAATAMRDLATAYLAMAEKNERLRKRVEAADAKIKAAYFEGWNDFETPCSPMRDVEVTWLESLAYRATEGQG